MEKHTLWTQRRVTGVLLILGSFLFLGAAGLIPRDAQGNFIVNLPLREQLLVIATYPSLWQWSLRLFISGVIMTILGLALLTRLLWDAGDRSYSLLAFIAFFFGAMLMVLSLAFPLGVDSWAAQETVSTGAVPNAYLPLTLWTQALFVIYTILAFSALTVYGGALLSTRILPHWVGWAAIVYGLAGLVLTGFTAGNAPPFSPSPDAHHDGHPAALP